MGRSSVRIRQFIAVLAALVAGLGTVTGVAVPAAAATPQGAAVALASIDPPVAKLSRDGEHLRVDLDRRFRRDTVKVKVELPARYASLGKVTLNRRGDGLLTVPARRVKALKPGMRTKFLKGTKVIGTSKLVGAGASSGTTPTPTPTPTPTVPDIQPQQFSGSGDQVVRLATPVGRAFRATITASGASSNFAVWAVDSTGAKYDLLVNEIGGYSGTHLVTLPYSSDSIWGLEVTASGLSWTIAVSPLTTATSWASGTFNGSGSNVVAVPAPSAPTSVTFTHSGSSNFAVWAVDGSGKQIDLLVNEIGPYSGTVLMPLATRYLSVDAANASWSATR
jgi:hypothetical protein